jgi:hypothetical protein
MARGYRPGRTAKAILNGVGDIDVSQLGPEARERVLDSFEQVAVTDVETASKDAARRPETKLSGIEKRLADRTTRREHKNALRADRLEQGRLWRAAGIYEKTPHIDLPFYARIFVYVFLAGLDFYVFAEAWAVGTNSVTGELSWWVGGLFGLVVFGAGFLTAVQIKREMVSRRQRQLLDELREPDPRLVVLSRNRRLTIAACVFFLLMIVLGIIVRVSNESDDYNPAMVLLAGLVPVLAALVEVFLHDPMERQEARPNWIDRFLGKRQAKWERKLAIIEEKKANALAQVRAMYEADRRILGVEQHDLGIRNGNPAA